MNIFEKTQAKWIWVRSLDSDDCYGDFAAEFALDGLPQRAQLRISADSDYALYLNGVFVDAGQYDDFPQDKVYDVLDVTAFVKTGKNKLAIRAYHQGRASHQYYPGKAGLIFDLLADDACVLASGTCVKARKDRLFLGGTMPMITGQIGFGFAMDARDEDAWLCEDYDASAWDNAILVANAPTALRQRPTEKLILRDALCPQVVAQGRFLRRSTEGTLAQQMQTDFLSPVEKEKFFATGLDQLPFASRAYVGKEPVTFRDAAFENTDGAYMVLDLGREEAGLLLLEVDAPEGAKMDISWGQHLDDLRVRSFVGGRNFATRYITRQGRQSFMCPYRRFGGRYLEVHMDKPMTVYQLTVRPWEYPVENKGAFACGDSLHEQIFATSRRTLELCMHEHYEDTPWREQAFYIADSRNQALCGYYAFGEYRFPGASFDLYRNAFEGDLYADICAPSYSGLCIPVFVLTWPVTIWEQYLFSGDKALVESTWQKVKNLMAELNRRMENGLVATPGEKGMWNFYEWTTDLGGYMNRDKDMTIRRKEAPLQLFALRAFDAAAKLASAMGEDAAGYEAAAAALRKKIHRSFWMPEKGIYATYLEDGRLWHECELTQAMALTLNVVPREFEADLRDKLASGEGLIETTLSYSIFKYDALLMGGDLYAPKVFEKIKADWGFMLYKGATSFWETILGSEDFGNGGSLCHGWSAIPLYLYMRYVLGVYPVEPGFKRFAVEPVAVFDKAEGTVPTPAGDIVVKVTCDVDGKDIEVDAPEELEWEA